MIRAFRLAFYLVIGLLFGAVSALAFAVPGTASSTGAWRNPGSSPSWGGNAGGSVGGVASTIETVRVGNTYISVPVSGTISGSAVAATMVSALKMTPQAMLGGALLQWLMNQGMDWVDGEWKKLQQPTSSFPSGSGAWQFGSGAPFADTPQAACDAWLAQRNNPVSCTATGATDYFNGETYVAFTAVYGGGENTTNGYSVSTLQCPAGTTRNTSTNMCDSPAQYAPAGQSDWDQVAGVTPPDVVMNDICSRLAALDGIGCRVTGLGTKTAVSPISDSYTDGTGTTWGQSAKWSPNPTATNPLAGDITVVKTALTQNGTTTNSDGSTSTRTVNPETGAIEDVTTHPDGSTTKTVTNPETGSKTTTTTASNGDSQTKTEAPDKDFVFSIRMCCRALPMARWRMWI